MINIRRQPSDLRAIIRAAICRVTADAIHETAYRPADGLTAYYRLILFRSAKSLHLIPYAKRFARDEEFGKAITRVVSMASFATNAVSLTTMPLDQSSMGAFRTTVDK